MASKTLGQLPSSGKFWRMRTQLESPPRVLSRTAETLPATPNTLPLPPDPNDVRAQHIGPTLFREPVGELLAFPIQVPTLQLGVHKSLMNNHFIHLQDLVLVAQWLPREDIVRAVELPRHIRWATLGAEQGHWSQAILHKLHT